MLIPIAKKEIIEHVHSFRFLIAFLFILITFCIMMLTRHFDYKAKYDDYLLRTKAQEESAYKYANYNRIGALAMPIVPPAPMEIIAEPVVSVSGISYTDSDSSLEDDPLSNSRINLDMIALIGLLGSLLALLLSYDSVNREVREGTLRLLLSSAVPRTKVISGKILGGGIAALLPIATVFLLASMYLAITGGLGWGLNQWLSLLIIFMVSIIYVVLFYCLGTFLSSVILDQTLSVFSCFAVWILFVLVIPTISPYIAKAAIKIPDAAVVQREINYIMNVEREEAIRNAMRPFLDQGMSREEAWDKAELSKLNIQYYEKVSAMETDLRTASIRQARLAIQLSCLSPYSMYLLSVQELSGMGIDRITHLINLISNWGQKAQEYIEHKFNEAKRLNPSFSFEDKLDVSDGPHFKYEDPALSNKVSSAIPYILLLIGYFLLPLFFFLFTFNSRRTLL